MPVKKVCPSRRHEKGWDEEERKEEGKKERKKGYLCGLGSWRIRFANVQLFVIDALQEIFNRPDGKEWDFVFNCGGETRYSQGEERYRALNLALSVAVAKEAAKRKVKCFIELSTGSVYKPNSSPSKEGDKLKPWSQMAVVKQEAEEALSKIEGYAAPFSHETVLVIN